MEENNRAVERIRQRLDALSTRVRSAQTSLNAVSRATERATAAVKQATSAGRAVATLLSFDEINRLKEATASSSGGSKSSGKKTAAKTKTALTSEGMAVQASLPKVAKGNDVQLWSQLSAGLEKAQQDSQNGGKTLVERLQKGISDALGDPAQWVTLHLWDPIQKGWLTLGALAVAVGVQLRNGAVELWQTFQENWNGGARLVEVWNTLKSSAASLWQNFLLGWGSRGVTILNSLQNTAATLWQRFSSGWGSRAVRIGNSLTNAAATLWQKFSAGWGTRTVSVVNTLKNSASSLWEQFRSGWSGRSLGLSVHYNSNVSGVKRAVYKALGLSGWPSISFAARGGVFRSATLTMLGEAGTEAVVPLENNTGWMDIMAQKLGERMGGAGSVVVPVYIGGEKLAEAVVDAINDATRRSGVSPLYI
jgi:hypothetical protein